MGKAGEVVAVSTHAPLAGSDDGDALPLVGVLVSTHAPLAGSDCSRATSWQSPRVSTHAPLAGSDKFPGRSDKLVKRFQPTLPLRGATKLGTISAISLPFQPTLPLRGATASAWSRPWFYSVSTHAPLAGSDSTTSSASLRWSSFNPRSPCGERRLGCPVHPAGHLRFNPRSPCGERLAGNRSHAVAGRVSTHAPLAGSDAVDEPLAEVLSSFNPRSPCGERQDEERTLALTASGFNPRSPCGERLSNVSAFSAAFLFQPTLPLRGATSARSQMQRRSPRFNPRSPCGERHGLRRRAEGAP